tara:strand:- start:826 stop:1200 length:375 start_codon:yes stop_codon:yes gene_type:complete
MESKKMKTTLKTIKKDATYDGKLDLEAYENLVKWFCYHEAKKEYNILKEKLSTIDWTKIKDFDSADHLISMAKENAYDIVSWSENELTINNEPTGIFENDNHNYDNSATFYIRTNGTILSLLED